MTAAAQQLGPRYYAQPVEYKGVVFGVEKISDCLPEVWVLSIKEWAEVGNQERYGDYNPDIDRVLEYEARNGFFVFTIRSLRTLELEGYLLMTVASSLKQAGKLVAQESAVYLQPTARNGRPWLMRKVMKYMEDFFRELGVHSIEVGHHPDEDGDRAGKFFERCGYFPSTVTYQKVLTDA